MSTGRFEAIFCDGDEGMCESWDVNDYAIGTITVGGVRITREQPAPGWRHDYRTDESLCPACATAVASLSSPSAAGDLSNKEDQ